MGATARHVLGALVILGVFLGGGCCAVALDWDTSIVELTVNGRKYESSYEILDTGDHVFLPLLASAQILDAEIGFDQVGKIAEVRRSWDGLVVQIDFARQVLTLAGQEHAIVPGAIVGDGELYLPIRAAESSFAAAIEWSSQRQAVAITVARIPKILRPSTGELPVPDLGSGAANQGGLVGETVGPPAFSLGSIQYRFRKVVSSDESRWTSTDGVSVDAHCQFGGVPVDLAVSGTQLGSPQPHWSLDHIAATYRTPTLEVILGDTSLGLRRTVQDTSIRGFRATAPSGWTTMLLQAVTEIVGYTFPGAAVELKLNGYFIGTTTADNQGRYEFKQVPLQITRANSVELTITTVQGEISVVRSSIVAAPYLLPAGTVQTTAGVGLLRGDDEWDRILAGAAIYAGVNSGLSVGAELARLVEQRPEAGMGDTRSVGSVGLALRAHDNLVFALDWMASQVGNTGVTAQGMEAAAALQWGQLAVEGILLYREPDLALLSRVGRDAKGFRIIAEYEVSSQLNLQLLYELSRPVSEAKTSTSEKWVAVARWRPSATSSTIATVSNIPAKSTSATVAHQRSFNKSRLKLEVGSAWGWLGNTRPLKNLTTSIEWSQALSARTTLHLARADRLTWPGSTDVEPNHYDTTTALLSWLGPSYALSVTAERKETILSQAGTAPVTLDRLSIGVSKSYGSLVTGLVGSISQSLAPELVGGGTTVAAYVGAKLSTGWQGEVRTEYFEPFPGVADESTLRLTSYLSYTFANGMALGLDGHAERRSTASTPDYYLGISLSHGLGFSNAGLRGFPATKEQPMSFVDGYVYLDVNQNGHRDADERTLPGIPVFLAGRRTQTDQNGYYRFNFLAPGVYQVGLDPHRLSADYSPVTQPILVKLSANSNYSHDMGVALHGTIDGTVFLDQNGDGVAQATEPRPPWVKVILDDTTEAFTDKRGYFSFGQVSVGQHQLRVDPATVPFGAVAPKPVVVEVSESHLDVWDALLPLLPAGQS